MALEDLCCEAGLVLTLGISSLSNSVKTSPVHLNQAVNDHGLPSLTLGLSTTSSSDGRHEKGDNKVGESSESGTLNRPCSSVSMTTCVSVKMEGREKEGECDRKKLRLKKEQYGALEESFKLHSTLNPDQKLVLAERLNLRPRQVEVWFQNRRARTKLKQTEMESGFLKKCYETLADENRRLQQELQELKALPGAPIYKQVPATTLTVCPSCEKIVGVQRCPTT